MLAQRGASELDLVWPDVMISADIELDECPSRVAWSQEALNKAMLGALIEVTPMRCVRDAVSWGCPSHSFRTALTGGLVAALAFVSIAHAQLLNPFPGFSGPVMNDQDWKLARAALRTLLNHGQATVGRRELWNNPADRRHGSLTMLGSFQYNGMDCRRVQSSASFPDRLNPRVFTLRLCRIPSGEWKTL